MEGGFSMFGGGEVSDELWGMWRGPASVVELEESLENVGLQQSMMSAVMSASRKVGKSGGILIRDSLQMLSLEVASAPPERAAPFLSAIQHLAVAATERPESVRIALSSALQAGQRLGAASCPKCSTAGLKAIAAIFQACAAVEGTAALAVERSVTEVVDRERGWEVVLQMMQAQGAIDHGDLQTAGAGALWGLSRWSKAPSEKMHAWMREAMRVLLDALQRHSGDLCAAKACSAALHLVCWRFPVQPGQGGGRKTGAGSGARHPLLQLSVASGDLLVGATDKHPGSPGLLQHVCGVLTLMALTDAEAFATAATVKTGLLAVRGAHGESNGGVQARAIMADGGWGMLLALSEAREAAAEGRVQKIMVMEGVLDAVWQVIEGSVGQNSSRRHEVCWRIAQNLHRHAEGGRHYEGMREGGRHTVEVILPVMQAHIECAGLQELHAWAIDCVLSHLSDGAGGGHSEGCECGTCCIGRQGVVVGLVGAMERHERVRGVQLHACQALLRLSMVSEGNALRAVRSGAVGLVVRSMRRHVRSAEVQLVACKVLQVLCAARGQALEQVDSTGGIQAMLECLRFHAKHIGIVGEMCSLLRITSWGHEQRKTMAAEGGVGLLLQAMSRYRDSVTVQRHGCGCLHALSWSTECKDTLTSWHGRDGESGIFLIVNGMMFHPEDVDLQQQACSTLAIVSYFVDVNKREICEKGGIAAIICAMQTHTHRRGLQEQGCLALWSLASRTPPPPTVRLGNGEAGGEEEMKRAEQMRKEEEIEKDEIHARNKSSMANGRGIEVLVEAVRVHSETVVVVERACRALTQLSHSSPENALKICKEEGLPAICKAMEHHSGNSHVLEQAIAALKNVFSSVNDAPKGTKRELNSSHVANCVTNTLSAMRRHTSNVALQRQACAALGNMALNSQWANRQMESNGAVQAVVAAMLACMEDDQVQGRACQTLFVFTHEKANLGYMRGLNRKEEGASRPSHATIRALGRHPKNIQVVKMAMNTVIALADTDKSVWRDLVGRCGFRSALEEARRAPGGVWGSKEAAAEVSKLYDKLMQKLG